MVFKEEFNNKFETKKDNPTIIYHATKSDNLENIKHKGIIPYEKNSFDSSDDKKESARMELRKLIDGLIDEYAAEGGYDYKRKNSFYCSPEVAGSWNNSDVILEIKIDPTRVSVFDSDLATAVAISWFRTAEGRKWLVNHSDFPPQGERVEFINKLKNNKEYGDDYKNYAKAYWASGIGLDKYNELPDDKKRSLIRSPEILIPFEVNKDSIKVVN